jgi:mannose-6-phosphate isomerase-like protein (cupin superfamily)
MENKNIEIIKNKGKISAIIIYDGYHVAGNSFFTPEDFPQQLGFLSHKKGKIIDAHTHKVVKREIQMTQEVLIIKKGKIRVDFYDYERNPLGNRILGKGDVILVTGGGHGYEVLEDVEMIEVKQGPYLGKDDKVRFKDIKK